VYELIYSVALRAGLTETETQEAVQETVIAVAKRMPEFRADPKAGSFKGFLLQVTGRRITDQFRRRAELGAPTSGHESERSAIAAEQGAGDSTAPIDRIPDPAGLRLEALFGGRIAEAKTTFKSLWFAALLTAKPCATAESSANVWKPLPRLRGNAGSRTKPATGRGADLTSWA
jgi:hypothetical protein